MIVLACGSRTWTHERPIHHWLNKLWVASGYNLVVIEGGARGADRIAGRWASQRRLHQRVGWVRMNADWKAHGKAAGPIRNQQMLEWLIDGQHLLGAGVVLAFKLGFDHELRHGGTEDMVKRARAADVKTIVIDHL